MTEKLKEKAKLVEVTISESSVQRAKLEDLIYEHNRITLILQDSEKYLRYAEILDPKLNRVELIKRLVSRKGALKKEISTMLYSIFNARIARASKQKKLAM